ncbi:MAG TPA: toll/interleukin-1 receptor domain-containing protein [Planctomycetaceae bacterium]|jgi:hypothetical protein|nr:toll/interleukin-1 receptor domain-containing protein [Planctomycetaceae bacterium]
MDTGLAASASGSPNYRIFFSYGSADVEFAKEFQQWFLTKLQVQSFLATTELKPGDDWRTEILDAIRKCDIGIVLLTSQSLHRDWVQFEVGALDALGKKIVGIRLPETTDSQPTLPVTLQAITTLNWATDALRITKEVANKLNIPFSERQLPTFCMEPIRRTFSEPDLLYEIVDRCHEAVQKPFHPFVKWEEHRLLPVLVDHVFPRFLETLESARVEMKLPLPSDRRVRVAQQLLRLAHQSLDAITIVDRDDWLFTGDPTNQYLNANVEAARRLDAGKARRIVIVGRSTKLNDPRVQSTLSMMADASFHLRWIQEAVMKKACIDKQEDPVANTLIVNGSRMTSSQGTANEGWYSSSPQAIQKAQHQFDLVWAKATAYSQSLGWRGWRWGRDRWGLR